jgi:glucosamine--fructose-6-phosphate aminotransferase (isomerizing)
MLYLLISALGGRGRPSESVLRLPYQAQKVLEVRWTSTARYRYAEHLVVVSRGYNLSTAKEVALKLMETAYVVSEAFSEADFRHGPIAMTGKDFPVVAIVPPGKARPGMEALIESLSERGAELLMVTREKAGTFGKAAAHFLVSESCPEELSPVLYPLPIQVLAYELARLKGLDPDAPRGLSKITETW